MHPSQAEDARVALCLLTVASARVIVERLCSKHHPWIKDSQRLRLGSWEHLGLFWLATNNTDCPLWPALGMKYTRQAGGGLPRRVELVFLSRDLTDSSYSMQGRPLEVAGRGPFREVPWDRYVGPSEDQTAEVQAVCSRQDLEDSPHRSRSCSAAS